ncbi:unnamed protein product, partial [Prunus brigantina]
KSKSSAGPNPRERPPWRARDGSSAGSEARFRGGSQQPEQAQGQVLPELKPEFCDVTLTVTSALAESNSKWTNVRRGQNLGNEISQGKTKNRKTIAHGSSSEQCPQSVPVVRSVSEIMALLRPPKENTPPRRDLVEPHPPMMELSLYSIVSDYENQEYFNCMMSE